MAGAGLVAEVEDLVVQGGDPAVPGGEVPAAAQAHRGVTGREIERAGDRGTPVDEQRAVPEVLVGDSDPADVVVFAVPEIDPAEAEPGFHGMECGESAGLFRDGDVTFQPVLATADDLRQRTPDRPVGLVAEGIETLVEQSDEFLLAIQFLA